jgi:predicted ATP-dependent endonuclease of OLD family
MKLSELKIKNYCCIGDNEQTIRIDNIVVLIGPNNVGKSTTLRAYEAFSGTGSSLTMSYFHNHSDSKPIEITGTFSEISEADIKQIGTKWIYKHPDYDNVITYKWQWDKCNGDGIKYSWDNEKGEWIEGGMGGWDSKIISCLPTPITINPYENYNSLQEKIIDILTQAVKLTLQNDSGKLDKLIQEFNKLANEVKDGIQDTLKATTDVLDRKLQDIFPNHSVFVQSEAGKINPEKIISEGSHIRIKDPNGIDVPLANQGTGLQRTFLWSAIEALAETGKYKIGKKTLTEDKPRILLIEEPEVFLHPPAIRAAREALYKIAAIPNWQVIITTHSPIFVDVSKPHTTIIRVDKDSEGTHTFSTDKASFEEDERKRLQMIRACHPTINEFFFNDNIILVEGETEQALLSHLKNTTENDFQFHIVNCFGKANIPMFQKILNHFKLNYTVIHDVDSPQCYKNKNWSTNPMWTINQKIFEAAEASGTTDNLIIANTPDFEFQFFGHLQKGDKPFNAIQEFNSDPFKTKPEYLELTGLFKSIKSRSHPRMIKKLDDYNSLIKKYIEENPPTENKEQWTL